jgi:very-short-patch-repair endonuclease
MLWRHLRAKRFEGYKFKRQQPIGRFIVDFVCFEKRLIIELDGGQHMEQAADDASRDA